MKLIVAKNELFQIYFDRREGEFELHSRIFNNEQKKKQLP